MAPARKPAPKPRKGGPPIYAPETETARAEGKLTVRLLPEEAAQVRALAAKHGGLAALVRLWLSQHREA